MASPRRGDGRFPALPNQFFGNPDLSTTWLTQNIATATIEHDFNNNLTVKNQTRFAASSHVYQNVYPGSAVSAANTYTQSAYRNNNDRQTILNQTDWTYKFYTAAVKHTFVFGTEFGNQVSANARFSGTFAGASSSPAISAFSPTTFGTTSVAFNGLPSDARNRTNLDLAAVYVPGSDRSDALAPTDRRRAFRSVRFDLCQLQPERHRASGWLDVQSHGQCGFAARRRRGQAD